MHKGRKKTKDQPWKTHEFTEEVFEDCDKDNDNAIVVLKSLAWALEFCEKALCSEKSLQCQKAGQIHRVIHQKYFYLA